MGIRPRDLNFIFSNFNEEFRIGVNTLDLLVVFMEEVGFKLELGTYYY